MTVDFLDLKKKLPTLGVGLGLRREIAGETFANINQIDWLEFTPENYMRIGGQPRDILEIAASRFPLTSHGVKLSIGTADEIDHLYLNDLRNLLLDFNVPWFSDHFCYSNAGGLYLHDLLPLPRTRELVQRIAERIKRVQHFIERPLLLENISYYMEMPGSTYSEAEFISEVLEKADCGLLLDLNNVVVNSLNHHFDPFDFLETLPLDRVVQIHMAGHTVQPERVIDTHGESISDTTFQMLKKVVDKTAIKAVMLERDQNFPEFESILSELEQIRTVCNSGAQTHFQQGSKGEPQGAATRPQSIAVNAMAKFATPDQTLNQSEGNPLAASIAMSSTKSSDTSGITEVVSLDYEAIEIALARFWLLKKELPEELQSPRAVSGIELYDSILSYAREYHLQGMYPLCAEVLEENWAEIATDFALAFPSTHYSLRQSGAAFPQYMESSENLLSRYPYIAELAQMEKSKLAVLESEKEDLVSTFTTWDVTDDLRIARPIVNAVMQLCDFQYPVHKITLGEDVRGDYQMQPEPTALAIYRDPSTKCSMLASLSKQTNQMIKLASLNEFSYLELIEKLAPPEDADDAVNSRIALLNSFVTLQQMNIFVGSAPVQKQRSN